MRHSISIRPRSDYSNILDLIQEEDFSAFAEELSEPITDVGDEPYQDLTIVTEEELSEKLEYAVIALSNVVVTSFNIPS